MAERARRPPKSLIAVCGSGTAATETMPVPGFEHLLQGFAADQVKSRVKSAFLAGDILDRIIDHLIAAERTHQGYRHIADRTRTKTQSGRALIRSFHISHYRPLVSHSVLAIVRSLPVFPHKRTCSGAVGMSQTWPKAEVTVAAYLIKSLVPRDGTPRYSGSPALRRPSIYM
jgi:hypothetical protein